MDVDRFVTAIAPASLTNDMKDLLTVVPQEYVKKKYVLTARDCTQVHSENEGGVAFHRPQCQCLK